MPVFLLFAWKTGMTYAARLKREVSWIPFLARGLL